MEDGPYKEQELEQEAKYKMERIWESECKTMKGKICQKHEWTRTLCLCAEERCVRVCVVVMLLPLSLRSLIILWCAWPELCVSEKREGEPRFFFRRGCGGQGVDGTAGATREGVTLPHSIFFTVSCVAAIISVRCESCAVSLCVVSRVSVRLWQCGLFAQLWVCSQPSASYCCLKEK